MLQRNSQKKQLDSECLKEYGRNCLSFEGITSMTAFNKNIYLSDAGFYRIYRIEPYSGKITLLAGSDVPIGFFKRGGWKDGPALQARFSYISGMAGYDDTLYISDMRNNRIRQLNLITGEVGTLAGDGTKGWTDGPGIQSQFNSPRGIIADGIRKINLVTGETVTLAGNGKRGWQDGKKSEAQFSDPFGITRIGNSLYVVDRDNSVIRKVSIDTGETVTIAGNGIEDTVDGKGKNASFDNLRGDVTTDGHILYITDGYLIRAYDTETDEVTTLAGHKYFYAWKNGVGQEARFWRPQFINYEEGMLFIGDGSYNMAFEINIRPIIRRLNIQSRKVDTL
jgi:sugar lactone lactonase YvrE